MISRARLVEGQKSKPRVEESKKTSPERVVVDPTKGGAVEAKASQQSKALEVQPGDWIWDGVVKVLEVDLFSPAWEVRHGAAMALREVLKAQGKCGGMKGSLYLSPFPPVYYIDNILGGASAVENEASHEYWCNALAAKLLCIFVLDRFGDFVSDQVVAPVREMVSQTLASLLLHMPRRSVLHVHNILLQMIKQDFSLDPASPDVKKARSSHGKANGNGKKYVWEVRHAGLLGIKYEVAVRADLVREDTVKEEEEDSTDSREVLRGVVDAAVLG